jgi:hypothetical protein
MAMSEGVQLRRCAFCGGTQRTGRTVRPDVLICDQCAGLGLEVLEEVPQPARREP